MVQLLALALAAIVATAGTLVAAPAQAATQVATSDASGALNETITVTNPRITHRPRVALKAFAGRVAPPKQASQVERVNVTVYVNPAANDYDRAAAATLANEAHRTLVRYNVPKDRVEHATAAQERADVKPGTWQIEVNAKMMAGASPAPAKKRENAPTSRQNAP